MSGRLSRLTASRAAATTVYGGLETAASFGDVDGEWQALDAAAGLLDLSYRRTITASGEDRIDYLQGQLSADVAGLEEDAGAAALLLDAQGHVQAVLAVYRRGESVELIVDTDLTDAALARLEQFVVADDVEFAAAAAHDRIGLAGPGAADLLAAAGIGRQAIESIGGAGWRVHQTVVDGAPIEVFARGDLRVPCFELLPAGDATELWERLEALGARPAGTTAFEALRVESGTPRLGHDVDATRLALEPRLEWAIHFAKGCYVGQEIVERAVSRGRIKRSLFLLGCDDRVEVGAAVAGGSDKDVVTSVAHSPRLGWICLAYMAVDETAGDSVSIEAAKGLVAARVLEWPRARVLAGR